MITKFGFIAFCSLLIMLTAVVLVLINLKEDFEREITDQTHQHKQINNIEILKMIIGLVLGSRLVIYLFAYLGFMLFSNSEISFFHSLKTLWTKWDAVSYLNIAENGYRNIGADKYLIVYFPLYPMIVKFLTYFFHDTFFCAMLLSNISLIISCFYLYKLILIDFDENMSFTSVKYFLISPLSFFYSVPYNDSLLLALTISAFYYMRNKKWFLVGLLGALASATRIFGILVLAPALIEFFFSKNIINNIKNKNYPMLIAELKPAFNLLLIPLGFLSYFCVSKFVTGDWFMPVKYLKENWGGGGFGFFPLALETVFYYANSKRTDLPSRLCTWWTYIYFYIYSFLLTFYSFKKIRLSYVVYIVIYLFCSTSHTWPLSGSRYIADIFPLYIVLALLAKNRIVDFFLSFVFIIFLAFYTLAYTFYKPIM